MRDLLGIIPVNLWQQLSPAAFILMFSVLVYRVYRPSSRKLYVRYSRIVLDEDSQEER